MREERIIYRSMNDEQRSQAGCIGVLKCEAIFSLALRITVENGTQTTAMQARWASMKSSDFPLRRTFLRCFIESPLELPARPGLVGFDAGLRGRQTSLIMLARATFGCQSWALFCHGSVIDRPPGSASALFS